MLNFLKQVGDYAKESVQAARYIGQGMAVIFDHMRRRPVTVQYPYEKLIPSERFRGRIHFEFDKCIACEVCTRVCPINLNVVDWDLINKLKRRNLSITVLTSESVFSAGIASNIVLRIACLILKSTNLASTIATT
jgi:NAD(P)H-quinone oxidoreductase subunit I